jgi:hypothetical protein
VRGRGSEVRLPAVEARRARAGEVALLGVGVVVQEDGHCELARPPLAERARFVGGLRPFDLGPAQRDERHDVECSEAGVFPGVIDDRALLRHRGRERSGAGNRVARTRSGEREHRAVVVGVGMHVDERRAARAGNGAEPIHVAPFGHVDDALQHGGKRRGIGE